MIRLPRLWWLVFVDIQDIQESDNRTRIEKLTSPRFSFDNNNNWRKLHTFRTRNMYNESIFPCSHLCSEGCVHQLITYIQNNKSIIPWMNMHWVAQCEEKVKSEGEPKMKRRLQYNFSNKQQAGVHRKSIQRGLDHILLSRAEILLFRR